jgi:hypothetical protein
MPSNCLRDVIFRQGWTLDSSYNLTTYGSYFGIRSLPSSFGLNHIIQLV